MWRSCLFVCPSVFAHDLSPNILSDFHENRLRNSHALFKVVNKHIILIFMCRDWIVSSWVHRISMWCLLGITSLVKSGSVKRAFYLGDLMKFWPYILHFTKGVWWNFGRIFYILLRGFDEILAVYSTFYLGDLMKFWPYILHFTKGVWWNFGRIF